MLLCAIHLSKNCVHIRPRSGSRGAARADVVPFLPQCAGKCRKIGKSVGHRHHAVVKFAYYVGNDEIPSWNKSYFAVNIHPSLAYLVPRGHMRWLALRPRTRCERRFCDLNTTPCPEKRRHYIFMAALRSRCGHYIFALWFLSFFLHGRPM